MAERNKTSVKFCSPVFTRFEKSIQSMPINRDGLIDTLIADQIPYLRNDLAGKKLSRSANRYISARLKRLGLDNPRTIALQPATAEALRKVVKDHGLVRDAFLNAVLFFFTADNKALRALGLPASTSDRSLNQAVPFSAAPMTALLELFGDPFHYLRIGCEANHGTGLYAMSLPDQILGFSCYLPDSEVPATDAWEAQRAEQEEMERVMEMISFSNDLEAHTPGAAIQQPDRSAPQTHSIRKDQAR
ncbi:MAG: hypothetical protein ING98_20510 [Rhodocyclaceae bacterium]|nr:hypothetical protein [Rhodocyclaceae bacterium]MCA3848692.1 hypothetical protein [Burkholderia sp.]